MASELSPTTSKEFESEIGIIDYVDTDDEGSHKGESDQVKSIADNLHDAKITAGINIYSSDIEMYLDKALKESRVAGSLNPNEPPDLTFAVKCLIEEHQVTSDLNKGFFSEHAHGGPGHHLL